MAVYLYRDMGLWGGEEKENRKIPYYYCDQEESDPVGLFWAAI